MGSAASSPSPPGAGPPSTSSSPSTPGAGPPSTSSSPSTPGAGPPSTSSLPAAALPEELVEEILLRFPPGEPASLLRAALVCKRWRRLVSGPGFRRRFCELHRTPPMLGMVCNKDCLRGSHFVPTTAFRPRHAFFHSRALDSRHGRVLLLGKGRALFVWDPITGEKRKVPSPPQDTGVVNLDRSGSLFLCRC